MKKIEEYSKDDFIQLITAIISDKGSEKYQDELLEQFIELAEHPSGSDLIYYPETGESATPEVIAEKVQRWRLANGKSGFKEG